MKRVVFLVAGLALAGSLAACESKPAGSSAPAAGASASDSDALAKQNDEFLAAIEAKDAAKVPGYYASDAVMVLPGQAPLRGVDAIATDYKNFAADAAGKFDATNQSLVVGSDMAYAQGTYTVSYTNSKTKAVENGQGYYVVVYKKQPDGSWKIVQDLSVPTPAES